MYDVLYASVNGHNDPVPAQATSADLDLKNSWLFTDPVARALYAQQGRLDQLKADVLAYVMYEGRWASDELEFEREIWRLLRSNVLQPKDTFSHLSPHPTVYRATGEGVMEIAGRKHHFFAGQDIVFAPWLARVSRPSFIGPMWIGRHQSINDLCLSCEAFPRVSQLCECALGIFRQTLPDYAT